MLYPKGYSILIIESVLEPVDNVAGADICAVTALNALIGINNRKVVNHGNSVCGALTDTLLTCNAAEVADLHNLSALILVGAGGNNLLACRNELDDALGADLSTGAAAYTLGTVNLSDAVNNVHSVKLTYSGAVAKTDTCEGTGLVALAAEDHSSAAVDRTGVVEALFSVAFRTGTHNHCYLLFGSTNGNTQNLSNLLSSLSTTGDTAVGRSFALSNSGSVTVAAGVAAATAVCAGKALTDCFLLGVNINMEYLSGKGKDCAEDCAKNTQY